MFDIPISASFYDSAGQLVGSENGFLEGQEVGEGDKSGISAFQYWMNHYYKMQ